MVKKAARKIDRRQRAHRTAPPGTVRIVLRCIKEPTKHAKMLQFKPGVPIETIRTVAAILDGTSDTYIHPPAELSPVGKCANCGSILESTIEEVQSDER